MPSARPMSVLDDERRERLEHERFFELLPDLLAVLSADGALLRVNGAWERILGWLPRELIGRRNGWLIHPEDLPRLSGTRTALIATGRFDHEFRLRCRDGSYRRIKWTALAVPSEQGFYLLGRDVTEERRREAELLESGRRYRALFNGSPVAKWVYDRTTSKVLEVNEAALRTYGYSRDEFLSLGVRDLLAAADVEQFLGGATAASEATAKPGVFRVRRKDGAFADAEITAIALTLDERPVTIVVARDLSEQRTFEAQLLERTRLAQLTADVGLALTRDDPLRETLQNCAEALVSRLDVALARIWIFDADRKNLEMQASAGVEIADDSRFSRIPVDRPSLASALISSRLPRFNNDIATARDLTDASWPVRYGFIAFAGHPLLVDDEVVGVTVTFSKRPFTEAVLSALNGIAGAIAVGVQRKLVERSKAELEAQLRQSQRLEAVGSLAGGIAHDFNNLLSVILSYSSMLVNDHAPGTRVHDDLLQIQSAGERAAALTRQLLAFSRRQILRPRVVDLNEVLEGLTTMLQRLIGETIDFAVFRCPEPAMVNVDPAQMEQVIVNLAVNARDAMPRGGKLSIEVQHATLDATYQSGHAEVQPGSYVMLAVSDTGTGMDAATQARIFEPFFTTKEVGKGTGLGLSTVFGIVRQSGGHVWVYSEPGRGSCFKVYLPRAFAEPEAAALPPEPPVELRGSETILLVEDEEQVRSLAKNILTRAGYTVVEAANGSDALQCAVRPGIDLLLTDMVMPRMGGAHLASRLAAERPELRVVFMSGYTDTSASEHGLPAGAAFVQKPFTPEALLRKIRSVLTAPSAPHPEPRTTVRRVMLIDDQAVMLRLLSRALSRYELVQFTDPREALSRLRGGERFDAIVCDVYMPGMTGPEFQSELRRLADDQAQRMLFLTGALLGHEMSEFVAFNQGRILHKPVDLEALRRSVEAVVEEPL